MRWNVDESHTELQLDKDYSVPTNLADGPLTFTAVKHVPHEPREDKTLIFKDSRYQSTSSSSSSSTLAATACNISFLFLLGLICYEIPTQSPSTDETKQTGNGVFSTHSLASCLPTA